jgi:hypothetical protein
LNTQMMPLVNWIKSKKVYICVSTSVVTFTDGDKNEGC